MTDEEKEKKHMDLFEKAFPDSPQDVIDDFKEKRFNDCFRKCLHIIKTEPENCSALLYLGSISHERKEYKTAIRYFKKITQIIPIFFYPWNCMGESYVELGQYEDAYNAYLEVVRLNPKQAHASCMCALMAYKQDRTELALGILDLVFEHVKPEQRSMVTFCKGRLEEDLGNEDDALISYVKCLTDAKSEEDKEDAGRRIYGMLQENK